MNYKYLFWLVIGLIIGYIFKINNIEGFKDLVGCPDDGTHTTQDDSIQDKEGNILGIIDSQDLCQPGVPREYGDESNNCNCKNRYKIKIKDYSLPGVNLMGIPFYGLLGDLSDDEKDAAKRLLKIDDDEQIDLEKWEDRFNTLESYVRLDTYYGWSNLSRISRNNSITNLQQDAETLGLSPETTSWPPRVFLPFNVVKSNIIPYYNYANLYEETDGNKKSLYISIGRDRSNWNKIKVEFIYDIVNTYNVYISRVYSLGGSRYTSNPKYLKIISNNFTDEFDKLRSLFTLYDKDNPNIYITFEIIPDYSLKLNKEKIKSFIYNSLIES